MSEPAAVVYVELGSRTRLVGRLFVSAASGRETATFEYDEIWIDAKDRFALEPALVVSAGPYHAAPRSTMFGALGDSATRRLGARPVGPDPSPPRRESTCEGGRPSTTDAS